MPCPHCAAPTLATSRFCDACGGPLDGADIRPGQEREAVPAAVISLPASFAGGRYEVRGLLGEGGRKRVFEAYDIALRRQVALATVKTEGLDEAGLVRVRREAQAMALLGDHPHIVTVFDIGDDDGRPFIVSQFMSGGSVEDLLSRTPDHRLPVDEALRVGTEIAAALEHAHSRGVVHRDLKPGNVWLTDDGSARLGDFGLAVAAENSRITNEGMMVGTVAYMAPEQALGGDVGPAADLYSLGALLYELVAGRPPFVGSDAVSIISQHLNTQPMAPGWHNPDIPKALGDLILDLLAKSPEERPASASSVHRRLRDIAANPGAPSVETASVDPIPAARQARIARRARFVGRVDELGLLRSAVESALEERGGLILVSGEPGIGKSRLVEEASVYARLRGAQVLSGRGYETEPVLPFLPFAEAIRAYVAREPAEDLAKELGEGASDVASLVSEVRQRLPDLPPSSRPDGDSSRFQLLESVSAFLLNAAAVHPIVLVLEDLHFADAASLRLLCHLARRLPESRLLVVGTYREGEVTRGHPLSDALGELRRERGFEHVALAGLSEAEVHELLEALAERRLADAEGTLSTSLRGETEGNPFFLEEVVRHLLTSGGASWEGGGWSIDPGSLEGMRVPEGIREVVSHRFSGLPPATREVLARASVLGREFDVAVLGQLGGLDEEVLLDAIEEAVQARLIVEVADSPEKATYAFAQPVVYRTLYEELSAPRRQRLHRDAAHAVEACHAANLTAHLADLAYHYRRAGSSETSRAIECAISAGEVALANFAYEQAARHWRGALELLEDSGPPEERAGLLARLGEMLFTTGIDPAGSLDCLEEALHIYEGLGQEAKVADTHSRLGRNLVTFSDSMDIPRARRHYQAAAAILTRAPAHSALGYVALGLAAASLWGMRMDEGLAQSEEALEIAQRRGNDGLARNVIAVRGCHILFGGRLDDGFRGLELAWEAADLAGHLVPAYAATWIAASAANLTGDPRTAISWCQRELATPRTAGPSFLRRNLLATLTRAHVLAGELGEARRFEEESDRLWISAALLPTHDGHLEEAAELWADHLAESRRRGNRIYEWDAYSGRAAVQLLDGDHLAALESHGAALQLALTGGSVLHELASRASLTLILAETDAIDEAQSHLARCQEILAAGGDWRGLAGRVRLAEAVVLAGERPDEADRAFGDAVGAFATFGLAWDEADGWHRWGRACAAADDRSAAQEKLSRALEIYRRIGAGARWIEPVVALKLAVQGVDATSVTTSIDLVAEVVSLERPDLSAHASPEGTVTILFSDIEGSTAANERLGDRRWLEVVRAHNRIVRREVAAQRGFEVKSQGDGFMIAFGSARRAALCAVAVQRALTDYCRAHPDNAVAVRIGIHTGEMLKDEEDFYGTNVNLAARVASTARGGQILASSVVKDLLESSGEVDFGPGQEVELRGITGRRKVHEIVWQKESDQ